MTFWMSTLPGMRVVAPSGEVTALAGRRLPLALLVYLALERCASRDTLLGLFWPERDEERARHSLSQAVHDLRRALGADTLRVKGNTVSLDSAVATDVTRFEAAIDGGRWAEALELYGGAFLDGVHLADTRAFEDWVERRRAQLARLHRKARREYLTDRLHAGDTAAALVVAQRWSELEPLEDEAQQRTIELLARLGRRAEALRQYESFKEALRREDLQPMPELQALAGKIGAGDVALVAVASPGADAVSSAAAVQATSATPDALTAPAAATASSPVREPAKRARWHGLALVALALALAVGSWLTIHRGAPAPNPRRVVVAALENQTGQAALAPVSNMAADWITEGLSETGIVEVVDAPTALTVARDAQVGTAVTGAEAARLLSRETNAGLVVMGRYYLQADSLAFVAQVVDARDGRVLRAVGPVTAPVAAPILGAEWLRRRLMAELAVLLDDRLARFQALEQQPPSYDAYREYMDGLALYLRADSTAVDHFERAFALDGGVDLRVD